MLEFKAECGHTIRAKDEDVGGVVRCSYCGRRAAVPDSAPDNLDFLFRDLPQSNEQGASRRGRRLRLWPRFAKRHRPMARFDPFAVILKMCYAAALSIIVIVVLRKYVIPLFEEGGLSGRVVKSSEGSADSGKQSATRPERRRRNGLVTADRLGLYVGSTPPGATVYFVEVSKAPSQGRIDEVRACKQARAGGDGFRVPDGTYVVDVVLPWNHPSLNDPSLPYYEAYWAFRRSVEDASDEERIKLVEEFFVPDEAWPVFIDQTEEQIFIVRQYRGVHVRNGRSEGVRALFLPKIKPGGRKSFSIAQLVTSYLPKERAYAFDENHVRNELKYYDVPASDLEFVAEALARVGVIPYVTPDARTRLFKISIHDGAFAAKVIREASE